MLDCLTPVLNPRLAKPLGPAQPHWAQKQLSEYVLDILAEHAAGYSFDGQRQRFFSGPFHIGKATFKKLREGAGVKRFIIKRFARGLGLNPVERSELFIRYGELLLRRHTNEVTDIEAWCEAYLDNKGAVLSRLPQTTKFELRPARAGFGRFVRTQLWYRYNAAYMASCNKTKPICNEQEAKEATVRALAQKLKLTESALHDAFTNCSLAPSVVPRLAECLKLTVSDTQQLQALYVEGAMCRHMLWLRPDDIEKYFDPYIHRRLAHWLAATTK
jgi:hypothetical protein